jgi:NAD(P)-binding Rossmann-like domain/Flavin containing amine oxidoreductase
MTVETPDVTIVGAGMAGMTAALKLLEAGFGVEVIEASSGVGGKFGAVPAKGGLHDFAWHVFGEWCDNFWDVARTVGVSRQDDFVRRPTMRLLRPLDSTSAWPRSATIATVGSPETFWSNANSGVAHWSDVILFAYSQYRLLCDADIDREEFLNRVTVNGYMRSLRYTSDVAALLHSELLLRIWAIPSTLISARAYRTYLTLLAPSRSTGSSLLVMRKNFEDGFWRPFLATLQRYPRFRLVRNAQLTGIRLAATRDRVDEILVRHGLERASRPQKVRSLIVAIPPGRFTEVLNAPDSQALRQEVPGLLGLAKLDSQHTAALTLCFKRRLDIPGVGEEPVSLVDDLESIYATEDLAPRNGLASEYGISFMDLTRLGGGDHPTVLTVLASDVDSLRLLDAEEACQRVLAELRRYVRFDAQDIDWSRTHYQPHPEEPLFVNSVGSWEYRPEVRLTNSKRQPLYGQIWRKIHNLYLAGDYCRSQIDIVSLEGTVHTAIWAAHALSRAARAAGASVAEVPEPARPEPLDLDQVNRIRDDLERWADLAARRSRLVKEDLLSAAGKRRTRHWKQPAGPIPPMAGFADPTRTAGGTIMSGVPSTYPTFANPVGHEWGWLEHPYATKPVTLKSGAVVSIPLLFWETQTLCIQGLADAESVDLLLREQGLRARRVDPDNPAVESHESGQANVHVWATSYGGTSLGPVRSVHGMVAVHPRRECKQVEKDAKPDHWWWWWSYGDSILNQEFYRDVLGVRNEFAAIEMSYLTDKKVVRLLEDGGTALRIRASVPLPNDKRPRPAAVNAAQPPADARVRLVARRPHDDGENWATIKLGEPLGAGPIRGDDIFYVRKDSAIDRDLRGVGFRPRHWFFYGAHNGMVEIWDDRGSGRDPVRDTEDRYEVVRQRDGWLIREFEKPKEQDAKPGQ